MGVKIGHGVLWACEVCVFQWQLCYRLFYFFQGRIVPCRCVLALLVVVRGGRLWRR